MRGFYVTLPFRLGSLWVEHQPTSVGFGTERRPNDVEFFAGRVAGVWSRWRAPQMANEGR